MSFFHRCVVVIGLMSALFSQSAHSAESVFHSRTYNPLTQIFGLPAFYSGSLVNPGELQSRFTLDLTSHAEIDVATNEELGFDGESYYADISLDYGVADRWQLGIRIPFVRHSGGFLDATVENYHDLIGASNSAREGKRNQLEFIYLRNNEPQFLFDDSDQGFGDVQLSATYQVLGGKPEQRSIALHTGIKLPTGDEDALTGSGATDYSAGLGWTDPVTFARQNITLSANAGMLRLGDGDVLSDIQEEWVPYAGFQITYSPWQRVDLLAQIQGSGSYYDSDLSALGDPTVQISFGANIHFPKRGWQLMLGIVEDGLSDMMPDFSLHMELSKSFQR